MSVKYKVRYNFFEDDPDPHASCRYHWASKILDSFEEAFLFYKKCFAIDRLEDPKITRVVEGKLIKSHADKIQGFINDRMK